jgi:hypothetical protein
MGHPKLYIKWEDAPKNRFRSKEKCTTKEQVLGA